MRISVIVPCYNVEDTVIECLDSVLLQDYPLHEIIIVEDCSTDNTLFLVRQWVTEASLSANVKLIIHDENKGLGQTRGDGIAAATGDYLYFIDSDDTIDPDAIRYLVENADDGDFVTGGVSHSPVCGLEAILHYYECKTTYLCNRLIKKDLFDQAPHSGMRYLEDLDTLPRLLYFADKCTFAPEKKYHYNTSNSSSLNATSSKLKRWIFLTLCDLHNYEFFRSHRPEWIVPIGYPAKILADLSLIYQGAVSDPEEFNRYDQQTTEIARRIATRLNQELSALDLEGTEGDLSTTPTNPQ